jgi:hypothetical protein
MPAPRLPRTRDGRRESDVSPTRRIGGWNDPDFTLKWIVNSAGASYSGATIAVQLCWNHEHIPCDW